MRTCVPLRILSSAWMIAGFLAVGWGPLFVAEAVRRASPSLDADYQPQSFAMRWLLITMVCTILAMVFALAYALRLVVIVLRGRHDDAAGGGAS